MGLQAFTCFLLKVLTKRLNKLLGTIVLKTRNIVYMYYKRLLFKLTHDFCINTELRQKCINVLHLDK
jgi:hypothetical protein